MSKATTVLDQLAEISSLARAANPAAAQDRLQVLLLAMSGDELRVYENDIRRTISAFLPKRRKSLLEDLNRQISGKHEVPHHAAMAGPGSAPPSAVGELTRALRAGLAELAQSRIFLWSTFYRDFLSNFFADALPVMQRPTAMEPLATAIKTELSAHAAEVFVKHFKYVTEARTTPLSAAVGKSLGGLQRFLELPIEFYSARVITTTTLSAGRALRELCSAMLAGVFRGYANASLGNQQGRQLMQHTLRLWVHYSAFLTYPDFAEVFLDPRNEPPTDLSPMAPLVLALDHLLESRLSVPPLPLLSQLLWDQRRLDISLRIDVEGGIAQLLEIQCLLDGGFATPKTLTDAATRGASLVLLPAPVHLRDWIAPDQPAGVHVIFTGPTEGAITDVQQVYNNLELQIFERKRRKLTSDLLTFNFARQFPLFDPVLTKFFHVFRTSVRDLLRTIERRSGIRLWCSVRRSGKTVACFDLGDSAGPSTVVSQTAAAIHPSPNATLFKDLLDAALAGGSDLDRTFFVDAVRQCAASAPEGTARFVFVLDEYERLFGKLESIAGTRRELEHRVVLPLLDQMVSFARDNLLIFMGQQPDAHFILMAQNQLSAYVQQDSFPLFTHSKTADEFVELMRKVFRQMADFDRAFADAVFAETAGHPFLTVKLLVSLVDWLIEGNRTLGDLYFRKSDFDRFAVAHLTPERLGLSAEYDFFSRAIAEAIGPLGRQRDPWLHVVYRSLQRLAQESPRTFRMSRPDFQLLCEELRTHELGFTADRILSTAAQSNFLEREQDQVRIKIPLLGRLAAISRERLTP